MPDTQTWTEMNSHPYHSSAGCMVKAWTEMNSRPYHSSAECVVSEVNEIDDGAN